MNPDPPVDEAVRAFLEGCHRVAADVADTPEARRGSVELGRVLDRASPLESQPTWLPVLGSIESLSPSGPLIDSFVRLAPRLPWVPSPRATDGGTELALAPLDRVLDVGPATVGLMYVGPGATYPPHRHPPQELYLTLAGTGRWRYGGNDVDETVGPQRTLYNHPGDRHTVTAVDGPLLALYLLW